MRRLRRATSLRCDELAIEDTYTPYEQVKDFIKQRIVQERQNEVLEKYVADLKAKAKITINAELLKSESDKAGATPKVGEAPQTAPAEKPGEALPKAEPPAKLEPQPAKDEAGVKK